MRVARGLSLHVCAAQDRQKPINLLSIYHESLSVGPINYCTQFITPAEGEEKDILTTKLCARKMKLKTGRINPSIDESKQCIPTSKADGPSGRGISVPETAQHPQPVVEVKGELLDGGGEGKRRLGLQPGLEVAGHEIERVQLLLQHQPTALPVREAGSEEPRQLVVFQQGLLETGLPRSSRLTVRRGGGAAAIFQRAGGQRRGGRRRRGTRFIPGP